MDDEQLIAAGICPECGGTLNVNAGDDRYEQGTEVLWCPACRRAAAIVPPPPKENLRDVLRTIRHLDREW